jgi:L-asparagine oxygenase
MASLRSLPLPPPRPLATPTLRLPDSIREQWTRDASALQFPDYRDLDAWNAFCQQAIQLVRTHLPVGLTQQLARFFSPAGENSVVVENLPVDPQLPAIPRDGMRPAGKQPVTEAVIAGILMEWAQILAFVNEKNGAPIHEVTPVPGLERVQSNSGRVRFGFHSDNAFLPSRLRQRGIMLLGLCNDDTATLLLTADQILESAPPELADSLAKPIFRHACPASFNLPGAPAVSQPCPILWRDELGLARVSAASSSIEPLNAEARQALQRFRDLILSLDPTRVVVAPGTALLFKDDRVLHGREPVSGPRWLQRAYFTDSLQPLRQAVGSDARTFAFDARALLCA